MLLGKGMIKVLSKPVLTDEIHLGFLQLDAEVAAVLWCLSARLELDCVDFTAYDKFRVWDTAANLLDNLEDDSAAVFERSAIFVRTFVGGEGQKLSEEISMCAVDLDAIHVCLVA